jgi:predicted RNase H-like nuclease (RuvC/YqgF family)
MPTIHEHIESAKATFQAHFDVVKKAEASAAKLASAVEALSASAERFKIQERENTRLRTQSDMLTLMAEALRGENEHLQAENLELTKTIESWKEQLARAVAAAGKPATAAKPAKSKRK